MKTNSSWIKADYWMQTILGCCVLACVASVVGFFLGFVFLIPFGAWQILSGIVNALRGERLQQIYLAVVTVHLSLWFVMLESSTVYENPVGPILLIIIAIVIGIWKYTVVRADYISLAIIDVSKMESDDLLDA
jgi:type III secretory pathway component EscT